jgi:cytidylate kinase
LILAKVQTIAIDGSAASGKSTLGSTLAEWLNYLYLDTGVMYRAITWAVLDRGLDPADAEAVSELAETFKLDIIPPTIDDGRQCTVLVDDQDITGFIRQPEIDANVSLVSSFPRVRQVMVAKQREIAQQGPVVMVGRDIGTVVLPDAHLKIFTMASPEVRAKRRYDEAQRRGEPSSYEAILESMIKRDKLDREKTISPMIPAEDAIIVDTDNMSIDEVLKQVESLILAEKIAS